jgi:hypothetical protein
MDNKSIISNFTRKKHENISRERSVKAGIIITKST